MLNHRHCYTSYFYMEAIIRKKCWECCTRFTSLHSTHLAAIFLTSLKTYPSNPAVTIQQESKPIGFFLVNKTMHEVSHLPTGVASLIPCVSLKNELTSQLGGLFPVAVE